MDRQRRPRIIIKRTWKRDGSVNFMDMAAAVENLRAHGDVSPMVLRRKLLAGGILETRLAWFQLYESSLEPAVAA